jgi:hypothetical protein
VAVAVVAVAVAVVAVESPLFLLHEFLGGWLDGN